MYSAKVWNYNIKITAKIFGYKLKMLNMGMQLHLTNHESTKIVLKELDENNRMKTKVQIRIV